VLVDSSVSTFGALTETLADHSEDTRPRGGLGSRHAGIARVNGTLISRKIGRSIRSRLILERVHQAC
jgi:hypothetical protein